ncbi:MBL fold metallo-hydrolase [Prochlorococcus sp. MIT 1341]|uniref:MBL fold metallo-hydrolase n=1 Tax=Prochlorococcus sp. MIT 1341 TaxID=3096221 RepID=UPI002A750B50|nr:MBL fold metallo-hydrolase [Prochlorococcus sp. MIT 1341]
MKSSAKYYGSNGWLLVIGTRRVLIDPWLIGLLIFPPGKWLFYGKQEKDWEIPKNIDLILLTQSLQDHAHEPTLSKIDKNTTVVCPPSCIKKLKKIGFNDINALSPGDNIILKGLEIEATSGAPVPIIENGYMLKCNEISFYIEPHGYLDRKLESAKVDVVITPVLNLYIPIIGKIIHGKDVLPKIIDLFSPTMILASTTGGNISFGGILSKFISSEGSLKEVEGYLSSTCRIINPIPGVKYLINNNHGSKI